MKHLNNYITEQINNYEIEQIDEGFFSFLKGLLANISEKFTGASEKIKAAGRLIDNLSSNIKNDYNKCLTEITKEEQSEKRHKIIDKFEKTFEKELPSDEKVQEALLSLVSLNKKLAEILKDTKYIELSDKKLQELIKKYPKAAETLKQDTTPEEGNGDKTPEPSNDTGNDPEKPKTPAEILAGEKTKEVKDILDMTGLNNDDYSNINKKLKIMLGLSENTNESLFSNYDFLFETRTQNQINNIIKKFKTYFSDEKGQAALMVLLLGYEAIKKINVNMQTTDISTFLETYNSVKN